MRQEINLLIREQREQQPRLSFSRALMASGVFVLVLGALGWSWNAELGAIRKDIVAIEKSNSFKQQEVSSTASISQYQNQLKALEVQLLSKYQLWSSYKKITDAGKNGFSQHFYHIANLADENLSLYEIDLYERGTRLALRGYARKAEYIPIYINKLKSKSEFSQVSFGDLSIEKLEGHEVMRFSLDKFEKKEEEKPIENPIEKNIDISDLLKMTLASSESSDKGSNYQGGRP